MNRFFKVLKILFVASVVGTGAFSILGGLFFLHFSRELPSIITIDDYKPDTVTQVFGKGDVLVGEFFEQRRYVIPYDQIPEHVVRCFVAAEDDRFFDHQGVDFVGMFRAAFVNLRAGHVVQGGSTITQQVAKSILLTPERSFSRKIKEVILANRMERNLSKKQILFLYLNQIYFGEGTYGVEAAARLYFRKAAKDLTLAEAAILAGLPQAPSRYSPLHNPKKAKERQLYVLGRLEADGYITRERREQSSRERLKVFLPQDLNGTYAPYYTEHLRRYLLEKYGKENLYQRGLIVHTPLDPALSLHAKKAMWEGLEEVDHRFGYRGPVEPSAKVIEPSKKLGEIREYNLTRKYPFRVITESGQFESDPNARIGESLKRWEDFFIEGELYKALIVSFDDKAKEVVVDTGLGKTSLLWDQMRWAFPAHANGTASYEQLQRPSQILKKNDVVWIGLVPGGVNGVPRFTLKQKPLVQGALLSLNHQTGEVAAMVGGSDFEESEFNRATQAERQPGSSYKPVIYAAAVDRGFTPATLIQDSPLVFNSGDNEKWKPLNYDEHFSGDITFRLSLIKSLNIPTIKIVQDISIPYLLEYTKRLGLDRTINADYSIALGSFSATLLDMTRLYSMFARGGRKLKPIFLTRVLDREGRLLEEVKPAVQSLTSTAPVGWGISTPRPITVAGQLAAYAKQEGTNLNERNWTPDPTDPDRVMDPRTAYVLTHLMTEVATMGTGAEARNLKRAAAGKTGTTNDYMDAWFLGFTPQVTTGVWVGFDQQKSLGQKGTGGGTALPIWLDYMKEAVKPYPDVAFPIPQGVSFAYVHGITGKPVSASAAGAVREAFIEGTEPSRMATHQRSVPGGTGKPGVQSAPSPAQDSQTEDFLKADFQ